MKTPTVVLITGCSSGIGYELLKLFDREPYRIAATSLASSMDELAADPSAQSDRVQLYELDVRNYEQAAEIVSNIQNRWGGVDVLINNAGISYRSTVEDMTPEDEQRQIQINYLGAMHLIRLCLPEMRRQRSGRIINVSSVGGMMAMPTMASYSASKFALEGATEALWYEMRPWNIKATLVRPGFINSLAFKKVQYSSKRNAQNGQLTPYDAHYNHMSSFVETLMRRAPSNSAAVAKRIFKVAQAKNPPLRAPATPDAWLFQYLRRLLPRFFYHWLLYRSLPGIKQWGK